MKILLINHYAGSVQHGMAYRPYYIAKEWARLGHKVQIVAASFSHIRTVQPSVKQNELNQIIDGISYRWYKTPQYRGNGVGRVINICTFLLQLWRDAVRLAKEFAPDVVIHSSTYPMDIWPAKRIAKIARAKLVFEVHDLWPLSPIMLGGMSKLHPFILWTTLAERQAYKSADKVISMLPNTLDYMKSKGMAQAKYSYIPNGVDESEWRRDSRLPESIISHMTTLRSTSRPIVGYAGTHGLANALDVLINVAQILNDQVNFVLVGDGPDKESLQRQIQSKGITNITMLDAIPKQAIPAFLKAIDIAYIGSKPNQLYKYGISPNKIMDYMMSGTPIICAIDSANNPVEAACCGITIASSAPSDIAEAIMQLADATPEARRLMGDRGRKFALENHTYEVLAHRFLNELS